ncbi:MAG: lytic transglycosylase domain-containing protein [Bacillota bacterium]
MTLSERSHGSRYPAVRAPRVHSLGRPGRYRDLAVVLVIIGLLALGASRWVWRLAYPMPYQNLIRSYSTVHDLDPYLVASLIRAESKFDPNAVSHRGAVGLMQLMPDTARWAAGRLGLDDFDVAHLNDPDTNIRLGTWYLADLRNEFGGDMILALAAYNGGIRNVRDWVAGKVIEPGNVRVEAIPFGETRLFVRGVLDGHDRYRLIYGAKGEDPERGVR